MYKYIDSKGRMHFTQDIGQVPPEYRSQVERKVLKRDISITGKGGSHAPGDRVRDMERRSQRLERSAERRARQNRASPAARRNLGAPLANTREPRKYDKDCSNYVRKGRCRKILRPQWQAWNDANGGNNGKPAIRRRPGDR
jgi:hypothetical protein